MKLLNVLSIAAFGVLFAVGCSSSDTTSTSDTGTKTDSAPTTETGGDDSSTMDSSSTTETGSETGGMSCSDCIKANCSAELAACQADTVCKGIVMCIQACDPSDTTCQNACVKDNEPFNNFIMCGNDKCASACGG